MPRDRESIVDILNAISAIKRYVADKAREDFETDEMCQDAVIRRLEIIGEATKRLSEPLRSKHAAVPWNLMAGMRDRVIHGYDTVDLGIVWDTVHIDLSNVESALQTILDDVDQSCEDVT